MPLVTAGAVHMGAVFGLDCCHSLDDDWVLPLTWMSLEPDSQWTWTNGAGFGLAR